MTTKLIRTSAVLHNFMRKSHQFNSKSKRNNNDLHVPVMAAEVLSNLKPKPNELFIDMTFGAGGHTKQILNAAPGIRIVTLDRDDDAYQLSLALKVEYPDQIIPLLGKFSELPTLLAQENILPSTIDGMLFDFGCSSMQFDRSERGFSLSKNGPLDMRMDKNRFPELPTAANVLDKIDEIDLARILKMYGEEKNAKKIARAIMEMRYSLRKIETTKELADLINSCFSDNYRVDKLGRPAHMATKTFQALRIFVNDELNEINYGMLLARHYLRVNGRVVTITFHSLEDTIVKRHMMGHLMGGGTVANPVPLKYSSHGCVEDVHDLASLMQSNWQQLHKHVVLPTTEEIETNPRSRSAKLRAAIKIS